MTTLVVPDLDINLRYRFDVGLRPLDRDLLNLLSVEYRLTDEQGEREDGSGEACALQPEPDQDSLFHGFSVAYVSETCNN